MNVWIVTIYEPLPFGDTGTRPQRCGMLSTALLKCGHTVELWTSTFEHVRHQHYFRKSINENISSNFSVQYLDACGYPSDYSPKRFLHNKQTAKKFLEIANSRPAQPDIIFAPIPSLELAEAVVKFGSERNIPIVIDIRDLWPDVYFSLVPDRLKFLNKLLFLSEINRAKRILGYATSITAISKAYLQWGLEYAQRENGLYDKVFHLGFVDDNNQDKEQLINKGEFFRNKYNIGLEKIVFTFVGTFSDFYDIECILDAAKIVLYNPKVHIMIVGAGERNQYYLNKSNLLKNITMTGWVDFCDVCGILSITNVGLVAYSNIATMSLPNKPFEYMASHIPLLSSLKGELADIINDNFIGKNYEAGNSTSLASAICWFTDHPDETVMMANRAYALFEDKYQSSKIYSELTLHLERIVDFEKA